MPYGNNRSHFAFVAGSLSNLNGNAALLTDLVARRHVEKWAPKGTICIWPLFDAALHLPLKATTSAGKSADSYD